MYYFRDTANVIDLLGFNMRNMIILLPLYELGPLSRFLTDLTLTDWNMHVVMLLAIDVFNAMSKVHEAGVCHADIKSANYLIKQDAGEYRAVLTDFGVSRILDNATTVSGMLLNTVHGKTVSYAAPELHVDDWSSTSMAPSERLKLDVYSGGIILSELLTRKLAWTGFVREVII